MIQLDCGCGAHLKVLELYAGGHVVCHGCGASVLVPADAAALEEKFRFHCPHCEARVVGQRFCGEEIAVPGLRQSLSVPDPPSDSDMLLPHTDRRIPLNTDDLAARIGLPFPVGKLEPRVAEPPQPRFLHLPEEVAAAHEEPMPWPLPPEITPSESGPAGVESHLNPAARPSADMSRATNEGWPGGNPIDGRRAEVLEANRQIVIGLSRRPEASSNMPTAPAIPLFDAAKPSSVGELQVMSGSCSGKRIRLDFRRFVVGNERDCDLRPFSATLSRHHCVFKRDEYAVRVRDLGSNSGTYVNGRRIYSEAILKPGDDVTVGDVTLHVVLPESPRVTQMRADSQPSISDFVIL